MFTTCQVQFKVLDWGGNISSLQLCMMKILSYSLFFFYGKWSTENLGNLFKVKKLINGELGFESKQYMSLTIVYAAYQVYFLLLLLLFFFFFLKEEKPHPRHMDIPKLGVKSKLQPQAYATAMAMLDSSHICDLRCSLQQCQIFNPLSKARNQTHSLTDTMSGS